MIKNYMKVQGHTNYYRDPDSKAILIVDESKRQNYVNQKIVLKKSAETYEHINNEVGNLKQEVNNIKNTLDAILTILQKQSS